MSDKTAQPPASKFFGLPALLALFVIVGVVAYLLGHRRPSRALSAGDSTAATPAASAPVFAQHAGPASPKLPTDSKYAHAQGAWCSYAGELPVYFCGTDQAACEATGPGSRCIQGGETLWCLERFAVNDSIDRADCYWTPAACSAAQAKEKEASTLRVACQELRRD